MATMQGAEDSNPTDGRLIWRVGLWVGVFAVLAFLPALACGFVNMDDHHNYRFNEALDYPWSQKVVWAWTTRLMGVYQPLSWLLIMAEHATWALNPMGYHAVSLALHGAVAMALFALTLAFLERVMPETMARAGPLGVIAAGLATLLFCVHPLRAEAVVWLSAQPYLPSVLCMIVGVWAYLKANKADRTARSRLGWLVGSFALGAAAMLFKAVAVTFPLILLVVDWYPLGRISRVAERAWPWPSRQTWRALAEKVPLLILSVVLTGVARQAKNFTHFYTGEAVAAPVSARLADAALGVWFYPYKTLVPARLTCVYPRPDASVVHLGEPRYALCAVAVVVVTMLAWVSRRRYPGLTAAWLAYLIILAPNSGLVRFSPQFAADRYSYASSLPWVIVLGAGMVYVARAGHVSRLTSWAVVGSLAVGLSVSSWYQTATWRDSEALWNQALASGAGRSLEAQGNLAMALTDEGREAEAFEHYLAAVRVAPGSFMAHEYLAAFLIRQGDYEAAYEEIHKAIRLMPKNAKAYYFLGKLLIFTGEREEAESYLREALKLAPGLFEAHRELGVVLAMRGDREEALAHLQTALRIRPDDTQGKAHLAQLMAERKTESRKAEPPDFHAPRLTQSPAKDSSSRPAPSVPAQAPSNPQVATASPPPRQAPSPSPHP